MTTASPDREPTDLELMMLLDGELEPARRVEVEAFLAEAGEAEGAAARGKVAGMRSVSRVVATFDWPGASPAAGAPRVDLAELVMASLPVAVPLRTAGALVAPASAGDPASAEVVAKAVGVPAKKPAGETPLPVSSRRPANDNSRAIFGFAVAAAAAAAAVFFWGKTGDDTATPARDPIAMTAPSIASGASEMAPAPEPLGALADGANTELVDEPRYGVEVATVDFGARSGAIYYVPAGIDDAAGKAAVTTVVWLNDD